MATSGSFFPTSTRDIIVYGALRLVGAYAAEQSPRTQQTTDAVIALNQMLKTWQVSEFDWLRKFENFDVALNTDCYLLPEEPTIAFRPSRVYAMNYVDVDNREHPLTKISRAEYLAIPDKMQYGRPTVFYYDKQTSQGKLYVWPILNPPAGQFKVDVDRPIEIMTSGIDDFDCPPEWIEVIKYGLAVRLAPEYGLQLPERAQLNAEYSSLRDEVLAFNRDVASTFFSPDHGR